MKKMLITGASRGIGQAIAQTLLQADYQIVGLARFDKDPPLSHANFYAEKLDLGPSQHLTENIRAILQRHSPFDGAIFCAGMGKFGGLEQFSHEDMLTQMQINFISQAYITRALLPQLKEKKQGDLIYIGSQAALKGAQKGTIYCASKFALRGFTQALREECAKSHIRISLINPGMVATPFYDTLNFKPGKAPENYIEAQDIADLVNHLLKTRSGTVWEEVNLAPLKKVIEFRTE